MVKNPSTMKSILPGRQQEPACISRRLFLVLLTFMGFGGLIRCWAQDSNSAGICRFAVALPEMDGPLTLGIFSPEGELVRLLYQNAAIESVPAGLNGLLIGWDGKDESGIQVSAGTYHARGLIHGAVVISAIPRVEPRLASSYLQEPLGDDPLQFVHTLFPKNRITVKAAQDALYENPPLLAITAQLRGNEVIVAVEGLPLLSIPLGKGKVKPLVALSHGEEAGMAEVTLILPQGREIYTVSGLDRLVPLDAGPLEMPSDTFLSSHEAAGAGVSHP